MGGVSKKKKSKKTLLTIFHINTWKLVLVLILLVFLSATLLRFDHIKMTELREAVLVADEQEDDAKTISALNELHTFTLKHIIFNILEDNGKQSVILAQDLFILKISIFATPKRLLRSSRPKSRNRELLAKIQTATFMRR